MNRLPPERVRQLLDASRRARVLVVGDVMLDHFVWGRVSRISPEAPVPIVEFDRESFMPGGAANVARNLTALGASAGLFGVVGEDFSGTQLRLLLQQQQVDCTGLVSRSSHHTATKMRIVAQKQQITRLDRETRGDIDANTVQVLTQRFDASLEGVHAVSVGDYGKGVITESLLEVIKDRCRARNYWISMDPKPVHHRNLTGLSLITPNRKEAFEMAGLEDDTRHADPRKDPQLLRVVDRLMNQLKPRVLLITLGELGLLLCQPDSELFHVPTVAREVFDVSGAGDTVIASFTLAMAAGATPMEAAIFSNHAAGVVVGKIGTATVTPAELLESFEEHT